MASPADIEFSIPGAPGDLTLDRPSASGTLVTFTVHSAKKDLGTAAFQIRADLPAAYTDYDTADNSSRATYTYASTPSPRQARTDSLTVTTNIPGNSGRAPPPRRVSGPAGAALHLAVTHRRRRTSPSACRPDARVDGAGSRAPTPAAVDRPRSTLAFGRPPESARREQPRSPSTAVEATSGPPRATTRDTIVLTRNSNPVGDTVPAAVRSPAMRGRRRVVADRRSTENRLHC